MSVGCLISTSYLVSRSCWMNAPPPTLNHKKCADVQYAKCAFMSYCGPFNQQFRNYMINDKFTADCLVRQVPVSRSLDLSSFLADVGTIGDWNMDGLPTDPLSTQNGILVTSSSRFPLLIDPQGQALSWIQNKEKSNLPTFNGQNIVDVSDPKLKDKLEFCMGDGKSLIQHRNRIACIKTSNSSRLYLVVPDLHNSVVGLRELSIESSKMYGVLLYTL